MSLLGIDLGTSGVRAAAFRLDGTEVASRAKNTTVVHTQSGVVETDAEAMLTVVEDVLFKLTEDERLRDDPISALALSVQGEAVVPVDAAGRALAPAPLSMDRRGATTFVDLTRRIPATRLKHITGQPAHPMFSIYKIGSGGAGWRGAVGFRCFGDFVAARLGAEPAIDYSMAARTGAFDVDVRGWSDEILDAASESVGDTIPSSRFSTVVPSGTVIGAVSADAAARTGLPVGIPIVAGSHDQASSYIGGGGRAGSTSVFAFGSSDCLSVGTLERPDFLDQTGFATYPLTDSLWISLAGTAAGGWALAWFAELVGANDDDDMDVLFSQPASKPPRLLVLPYFAGSGTLDNDPTAHGVIAGLTLSTRTADLTRAFLESSGFELAKILDALGHEGVEVGSINAVGGGVRNRIALAIRTEAAGVPLTGIAGHMSARGAALTAGIGTGEFGGFDDLPAPAPSASISPSAAARPWYDSQRAAFRALYHATRPINTALSTDKENEE